MLKELPVTGERLVRLSYGGSAKDTSVMIQVEGSRVVELHVRGRLDVELAAPMRLRAKAVDDLEFEIDISPAPGQIIRVEEATVDFDGSDDDWTAALIRRRWNQGWVDDLCWVICGLQLRLIAA